MASAPTDQAARQLPVETIEERFQRLSSLWRAETSHLSSAAAIQKHPAFQEIISLGEAVVPFMLRELAAKPLLWVWALPQITGANPVAPEDAGRIDKMSAAWLAWGQEHGYQW
jgi:hypothetical protein